MGERICAFLESKASGGQVGCQCTAGKPAGDVLGSVSTFCSHVEGKSFSPFLPSMGTLGRQDVSRILKEYRIGE